MARRRASADVVWRTSRTSQGHVRARGLAVVAITTALGLVAALGGAQVAHAAMLTVTNCSDTGVSGDGSLRGEVLAASSGDTITFALSPSCSLITLASGEILIGKNLTIAGPGASVVAVSANNASRVFEVSSGTTVNLSGLTIENGSAEAGSGILNGGTLTLSRSTLSGNRSSCAQDFCTAMGGIQNLGALTVTSSTISDNSASCFGQRCSAEGGGIRIDGGPTTVTLTNSTLSGNTVSCTNNSCGIGGGGIWNGGTLAVTSSTLSGNSASCSGPACGAEGGGPVLGGISGRLGTATVTDTIVANSTGADCGTVTDGGHNLADDASCGFTTGSPKFDVIGNPLLGPLANNGGPTQTMALQLGSPAIRTGGTCPAVDGGVDQRGVTRKNPCDIGAYEQPPLTITPNSGPKGTSVTLRGEGFAAGEQVKFKYKTGLAPPKPPAVALCSAIANGNGTATCSGTIPTMNSGPAGAHSIVAKGTTSLIKVKTTFTRT